MNILAFCNSVIVGYGTSSFFEGFINIKNIGKSMIDYILRSSEYESLRAQPPRMRGFVVFAPENDMLVSQEVIHSKLAVSILGNLDDKDIEIYARIADLEKKYVPYWRARSSNDFGTMLEVHRLSQGFINVFLFLEENDPELIKIEKLSGITAAVPLELKLLVAAEREVR